MAIIETFVNSWLFVPSIIVGSAVLGIILFKEFFDPQKDNIEEEALQEVVRGEVEELVELFGSDVKKKISYGITPLGMVNKAWGYKVYRPLKDGESKPEDLDDDSDLYIEEDGESYKKKNDFLYFKIRPSGFIERFVAVLTDDILNMSNFTNYMIVPTDYVSDGEVLTVKDEFNPTRMAGVWLPDNTSATEFIQDKTYQKIYQDTMETTKEAIRSTNHLNLKFAQDIQALEKEEELLKERFAGKETSFVNEN